MSYDEHLISLAGGDGDVLDQIQRRADKARAHYATGNSLMLDSDRDREALLAMVREQRAVIGRVRELAENAPKMQNMGGWSPGIVIASDLIAALGES